MNKEERIEAYKEGYEQGKFDAAIEAEKTFQKKQEVFAQEMGFTPDTSPYYIVRKYKEKFEREREKLKVIRKETFMKIMDVLRFGYELPIDDIMHEMAKECGVEVEKMKTYEWTVVEDNGFTYNERSKAEDIYEAFLKAVEYSPSQVKSVYLKEVEE